MQEQTVLPPKDTETLAQVEAVLRSVTGSLEVVGAGEARAELPEEIREVIANVVSALRRGQAVTLAPHALRLTTQQAADLLGVSRPTLIKLLEDGRIPYETPNRHRRIKLSDLLVYQATRRGERREALRELAQDAQNLGVYESTADDYGSALGEVRAKLA
jgi:excisionase family DNA binding protein